MAVGHDGVFMHLSQGGGPGAACKVSGPGPSRPDLVVRRIVVMWGCAAVWQAQTRLDLADAVAAGPLRSEGGCGGFYSLW